MSEESHNTTTDSAATAAVSKSSGGLSILFLVFLSVVICTAAVLAVRGNGQPPSLYGGIALIVAPLLASWISRLFRSRRRAELLILLFCGMGCAALAWNSSRITPEQAFRHIFKMSPPPSATAMQARKQWYDGRIWLLRCDLPESDFQKLIASSDAQRVTLYEDTNRYLQQQWEIYINLWSDIAYQFWPAAAPKGGIEIYQVEELRDVANPITTNIFRDKTTGRTWIVHLD